MFMALKLQNFLFFMMLKCDRKILKSIPKLPDNQNKAVSLFTECHKGFYIGFTIFVVLHRYTVYSVYAVQSMQSLHFIGSPFCFL